MDWEMIDDGIEGDVPDLRIMVVGCGGGGCNTIDRLMSIGITGAETLAINTDRKHLGTVRADRRLLISSSKTRGFGTGGDAEEGLECALCAKKPIREILWGSDLVIITVGEGGGTGTGSAPVVAEIARQSGALVMAVVTRPFEFERGRAAIADAGIQRLGHIVDTLLVMDNDRLLDMVPNLPFQQAFAIMDQLMSESIKGLITAMTMPSMINLDFSDLRTIMRMQGNAALLYGEAVRPDEVVADALDSPLMDMDISTATGALVQVIGGPRMSMRQVNRVFSGITGRLPASTNVICGARVEPDLDGSIRAIAIFTGMTEVAERPERIELFANYER